MLKRERRGIALIWVVLMSALVLVAIIGISIKTVSEKQILNARSYSQRALLAAETGLAKEINSSRTIPSSSNPLAGLDIGITHDFTEKTYSDSGNPAVTVTYWVKVIKDGIDEYTFYSLGTISDHSTPEKVLARKAIITRYSGPLMPEGFALYGNGSIFFGNSNSVEINGSVFTNGTLDLRKAYIDGTAYVAQGGDLIPSDKATVTGGIKTGQNIIPFPPLNIDEYIAKADAFRSGEAPYDATGHPNLNIIGRAPLVVSVIQTYLGPPGTSSTVKGIKDFYDDVKNVSGNIKTMLKLAEISELQQYASNIVYYLQGPVTISSNFEVVGIIVVDGDLELKGGPTVGDPLHPEETAILVNGNVTIGTGNTELNGLLYVMGDGNFNGTGNFTCNGSVVANGEINVTGNLSVIFNKTDVPIEFEMVPGADIQEMPSSWREISYDVFDALH